MNSQNKLKYPIGTFKYGKTYSLSETRKHIKAIARLPKELKKAIKKLRSSELDMAYRKGGWTVRQVVHHLADSHMNAYIRMKLAVTEPTPIIKPYEEKLWAETEDGKTSSVKLSLKILTPLHRRWVIFLESLSEEDLDSGYFHPGMQRVIPLPEAIALYAWHSQHHTAHVRLVADGKSRFEKTEKAATLRQQSKTSKAPAKSPVQRKKTGSKSSVSKSSVKPVRKRRTKAEMEASRAEQAAKPKLTRAEILARARAARATSKTQKPASVPKKTAATAAKRKRRSSAEVAAEKAAKAAMPKLSRAEALAKARAARAAKNVQNPKKVVATAPKRKRRSSAEVAAEKAAKAAMPKLSRAEILAKARAARVTNAVKTGKPVVKKSEGPKLSRAEILAKARAARTKKTASSLKKPVAPTAKNSGETKRRGLSPERMAEIRAMRKKKS